MPEVLIHGAMFHLEGTEAVAATEQLFEGRLLAVAIVKQGHFYASLARVFGVPFGGNGSLYEIWESVFLNRSLCATVDDCLTLATNAAHGLDDAERLPLPWVPLPR